MNERRFGTAVALTAVAACTVVLGVAEAASDADRAMLNTPRMGVNPPTQIPPIAEGGVRRLVGMSSEFPGRLWDIDPASGNATLIVTLDSNTSLVGLSCLRDMIFGSDMLIPDTAGFRVGKIDPGTGIVADVSDQDGSANWHGLADNEAAGLLYSIDINDNNILKTLDPTTATVTAIGAGTGIDGRGMAYDDASGILYATNNPDNGLYRVDTGAGTAALIGATGVSTQNRCGLAYDALDRILYLNSGDEGNLYIVDTGTGAATLVGSNNQPGVVIDGLAWCGPGDPCDDCPCPEDVNRDGRVDTADLIKLLAAWGPCPDTECPEGFVCGGELIECGTGAPCYCLNEFDGGTYCGDTTSSLCDDLIDCPGGAGDCPPGFLCAVDSCCAGPECIPICGDGSRPDAPPPPAGAQTLFGIAK